MQRIYQVILFILLGCSSSWGAANSEVCLPVTLKMQNKNIVLPGVTQPRTLQVYFFKNISAQSLWLDHPVEQRAASAGWSSYLRAGNASALVVNRKNFTISCAVIQPGKVEYLDCAKVVAVCVPKHMSLNVKRKGTYWLAEDKVWDSLLAILSKRGVQIK